LPDKLQVRFLPHHFTPYVFAMKALKFIWQRPNYFSLVFALSVKQVFKSAFYNIIDDLQ